MGWCVEPSVMFRLRSLFLARMICAKQWSHYAPPGHVWRTAGEQGALLKNGAKTWLSMYPWCQKLVVYAPSIVRDLCGSEARPGASNCCRQVQPWMERKLMSSAPCLIKMTAMCLKCLKMSKVYDPFFHHCLSQFDS